MFSLPGHFLTIDGPRHLINEIAALASPTIHPTTNASGACAVRFWYHMSGRGMGSLRLFISHTYGRPSGDPVFMISGDQGEGWNKGSVTLNSSRYFQVSELGEGVQFVELTT